MIFDRIIFFILTFLIGTVVGGVFYKIALQKKNFFIVNKGINLNFNTKGKESSLKTNDEINFNELNFKEKILYRWLELVNHLDTFLKSLYETESSKN
jgi:hypothetical protein